MSTRASSHQTAMPPAVVFRCRNSDRIFCTIQEHNRWRSFEDTIRTEQSHSPLSFFWFSSSLSSPPLFPTSSPSSSPAPYPRSFLFFLILIIPCFSCFISISSFFVSLSSSSSSFSSSSYFAIDGYGFSLSKWQSLGKQSHTLLMMYLCVRYVCLWVCSCVCLDAFLCLVVCTILHQLTHNTYPNYAVVFYGAIQCINKTLVFCSLTLAYFALQHRSLPLLSLPWYTYM